MDDYLEGHTESDSASEYEAGFESLKDVEFTGETTEEEPEEPSLDSIVFRLRQPFEEDEKVRVENTDKRCELQARIDARSEAINALAATREQLEADMELIARTSDTHDRKLTSRIRARVGLRDKTKYELDRQKINIEERLAKITEENSELLSENKTDEGTIELVEQKKDYAEKIEPLSIEEKLELLKPEALAELSTAEYLALWRRLNPFYASHVTRQGVRDHNAIFMHATGLGELSNGFTYMLRQNKTIQSPAEVHYGLKGDFTEEDVAHALEVVLESDGGLVDEDLENGDSPEVAAKQFVERHPMNHTLADADAWGDSHAIHFARNTVVEEIYGAETDNEVFYVFPIDVIASQYKFGGHADKSFATAPVVGERQWNDLFVWPESGHIPLDSGIVFLPKSAEVSPETGSTYETVESIGPNGEVVREPFLDEAFVQSLTTAIETLDSEGFYDEPLYSTISDPDKRETLLKRLEIEFGLDSEFAKSILFGKNSSFLESSPEKQAEDTIIIDLASRDGIDLLSLEPKERYRLYLRYALESRGIGFKKAEETISSEAFWTRYFEAHPEERPKHIVFYDGDPTEAVADLMEEHGIGKRTYEKGEKMSDKAPNMEGPGDTHETDGDWLGYDANLVLDAGKDKTIQEGHTRFNELALPIATRMIREYAAKKSKKKH